MRRADRTGLLALLVALAAVGCDGGGQGRGLTWEYGFASGVDPERAAYVRARILEPGCGGTVLYEEQLLVGVPPAGMLPPELPAGTYGFSVEARDESCAAFAAGCAEVRVPDQRRVSVPLTPIAEAAACLPADCSRGRCPGPDGSVCSPAAETCNEADDDCDTAVDEAFDLDSDLANCGACGNVCMLPNATTECAAGTCGGIVECDDGFTDCDGDETTGCETDVRTVTDCGACGVVCGPYANAAATCDAGACAMAACDDGFADCDGDETTGCEIDIRTLTDCGACGVTCALANATATCASGSCEIETCNAGFGDCDAMDSNGCERDLSSDNDHCGACETRCVGMRICCAGACETSCPGGLCCL